MALREQIQLAPPYHRRNFDRWIQSITPLAEKLGVTPFAFAQLKLNGERIRTEHGVLYSSSAAIVNSLPHISDELNIILPQDVQFDGEAYCHGLPLPMIQSIVSRTKDLHPDFEQMEYHIFDIKSNEPQIVRFQKLLQFAERIEKSNYLKLVKPVRVTDHESAMKLVFDAIDAGYEGGIFRNPLMPYYEGRSVKYMLKCKPKERDEYRITNAFEGTGKYAGTLGALEVIGTEKNALPFHVGSFKITDDERAVLWELHKKGGLIGRTAVILYVEKAPSGKLPSSVYKCLLEDEEDYDARNKPSFYR
jgi:hypothetical protein